MANLLSRFIASFAAAAPVSSLDPLDGECNQLVGGAGVFNGGSTDKKLLTRASDASDPPYDLDQLGAGLLARWKQAGVERARIDNDGSMAITNAALKVTRNSSSPFIDLLHSVTGKNYLITVNGSGHLVIGEVGTSNAITIDHTTGLVTFEEIPILPAASPTTANQATRKDYVDTRRVSFSASFTIIDPSTVTLGDLIFGTIVIPGGGQYTVTKAKVAYVGGSHTSGGSVTFIVQQQGVGTRATLVLNDTNNAINTVYTDDVADFNVAENAILGVLVSARSGTVSEKNVTVTIEGYRTVF